MGTGFLTHPSDIARARAVLPAANKNPWLASLAMRRLGFLHARLVDLRDQITELPRRLRRCWAKQWRAFLPLTAMAFALAGGLAEAATITVAGGCTLADAIAAANTDAVAGGCAAGSGADTIVLAGGTVSLTASLPDIASDITIEGGGATIRRDGAAPGFSILRLTAEGKLTLQSTTLSGGSNQFGGGINVYEGSAGLNGSTITGNSAEHGGGVSIAGGTLHLTDSTISGNSASADGGGLYQSAGTATLTASHVDENAAAGSGGGIAKISGVVSLTDSTVTGNTSVESGGGIHNKRGVVSLLNCMVTGNQMTAYAHSGAGVYVGEGRATLSRTVLSGNVSGGNGGGIGIYGGTAFLTDSTVAANTADYAGGGIDNNGGSVTIGRSTISGNVAEQSAGIYNYSDASLSLTQSTLSGNSAAYVGALYNNRSTASLIHTTITGNSGAGLVGGIYNYQGMGALSVWSSIIAGQAAGDNCAGGGVHSGGFNIESGTGCGLSQSSDHQDVAPAVILLGPLALNAPGLTATHALLPGSAALDRIPVGTNGCGTAETVDQRGLRRPQPAGGSCDVGAYERERVERRAVYLPVGWRR